MTEKDISFKNHKILARKFFEMTNKLTFLRVKMTNSGVTKRSPTGGMTKYDDKLAKAQKMINEVRFKLENDLLRNFPDAPLYTEEKMRGKHYDEYYEDYDIEDEYIDGNYEVKVCKYEKDGVRDENLINMLNHEGWDHITGSGGYITIRRKIKGK